MSSHTTCNQSDCPSKENLSNWYDNGGDSTIASHVGECRNCGETVTFYRKVDETVRLCSCPPSYLESQILEVCKGVEGEILAFPLWMRALRIAAVAAVVCTVAGAVFVVTSTPSTTGSSRILAVAGRGADGEAMAELVNPGTPKTGNSGSGGGLALKGPGDGVRGTDLVSVSAAGSRDREDGSRRAVRGDIAISPIVHHVWVVDDLEACKTSFIGALPEGVEPSLTPGGDDSKCSLQVVLSDTQLQGLVNVLKEDGWALFTKDFPQPGEEDKVALTGRKVRYEAELVRKVD